MATGAQIMRQAGTLLNDEDHVRWELPELCDWINDAQRAIVLAKPSAYSRSIAVPLQKGTLQQVPNTGTPAPLMLVRIVRNLKSATDRTDGGRTITAVGSSVLDAQDPTWHDGRRTPFRREARSYVYDESVPLEFYVWPGNDGTGIVEAVVSVVPEMLQPTGDPKAEASYDTPLVLSELYAVPILDYVLYRCQSKDDTAANPGRATFHYQQFASAIGVKIQVEGATSPNSKRGT